MNKTSVETVSGRILDLNNPDPSVIALDDIAWSLSRLSRYNGHTIQEIPYTVAQHSIFVSKRLLELYPNDTHLALCGLLHDAGECYTGDLTGPLKKIESLRPIIKKIEEDIESAIGTAFGLDFSSSIMTKVKEADIYCQSIEAYNFMHSRGKNWNLDVNNPSLIEYQQFEMPKPNLEVYDEFLDLYYKLETGN